LAGSFLTVSIFDVVQVATSNNAILFLAANARAASNETAALGP
jgi:hypothetical protein